MTGTDEPLRKSKKFAVGDLPPSPTTSTGTTTTVSTNKRATRHHVKRRSSGRVHVSKLAPMARAYSNNNELDEEKKPMKRSQSNKSLTRLSSLERKSGMTGFTPAVAPNTGKKEELDPEPKVETISPHSPPTTPPLTTATTTNMTTTTTTTKKPTFHVSHTIPAVPIEQTMSVTADDLVAPDRRPAVSSMKYSNHTQPNTTTSSPSTTTISATKKKPFLKSQFVDHKAKVSNVAAAAIAQQPSGMTRTQQKLLLQREQSLIHDENNIAHPKNMIRLTREMEKMGKEYRCVRKYQDPMMDSLIRCQELQHKKAPKKPVLQQRTFSSVVVPTTAASTNNTIPHMEQRRQILLKAAAQQQRNNHQEDQDNTQRWSAGQFIERLFYGTS